jgi:protocatechuate 3,4-dioxygenase, beta subunit
MDDSKSCHDESRRQFIKHGFAFAAAFPSLCAVSSSCHAQTNQRQQTSAVSVGGGCDGCEGMYEGMPQQLSWQTAIASASEPGERLEISGIIYQADERTPAPDIILYLYQTDASGYYSPAPNTTGFTRRHGRLRGWLKTNARGEYKFTTIRPAPYPDRDVPAHIHPTVKEPDMNEYYIDDYEFDDDPLLTKQQRSARENRGGSGIIRLSRSAGGLWVGRRNITLGLNIPNYK